MLRLTTFGGCVITRDGTAITSLSAQRRALVVVVMVAAAGPAGVSRDVIAARLWPETDESKARLSLRQLLHVVHTHLSESELLGTGPDLRIDSERCSSDVADFRKSISSGDHAQAASLYAGPFLAGFFLRQAPAVDEWIESERAELARSAQSALEALAVSPSAEGTHADALANWRRLVTLDPLSGRLAAGYMQALVNAGDRASALRHARVYESLVQQELGSPPDAVVSALAHSLRSNREAVSPLPAAIEQAVDIRTVSESPGLTPDPVVIAPAAVAATLAAETRTARTTRSLAPRTAALTAIVVVALISLAWIALRSANNGLPSMVPAGAATVAVLPFTNLSANQIDVHASDGLTDELIGTLGRVPGLQVIARTSVFALRDRDLGIRAIADTLRVGAVVEGSWRRDGKQLRVSAQLVRASDQAILWSERYDRDVVDVLAVQDDIARAIAGALLPHLDPRDAAVIPPATIGTLDEVAHELYLRGRQTFFLRTTRDGIEQSRAYFEQAIARDSTFARAFAGLSDVWLRLAIFGYAAPATAFANAKQAADRALALDSTLAEAHATRGHALYVADFAWHAAERSFLRALELDPSAVFARAPFAMGLASQGRFDEALAQLAIARTIDPLSQAVNNVLGRVQIAAGRYDEALQTLTGVTTLDPQQDLAWQQLGHAHLLRGEHALGIAALRRAAVLSGARDSAHLAYALAVSGNEREARRIVQSLEGAAQQRDGLAVHLAIAYAGLGDRDRAFRWLERGFALRASFMLGVAVEPGLVTLHSDPRWALLLRRMDLPPAGAQRLW